MTEPTKGETIATVTKLQAFRDKNAEQPALNSVLTNYISTGDGKKAFFTPRPLLDIVDDFYKLFPNIIHVNGELYDVENYRLIPLTKADHLERRILASNTALLFDNELPGAARFKIFYDFILLDSQNPKKYKTAVNYPMWPPRVDILCLCPDIEPEDNGAIDEFAEFFCFVDEGDKTLFKALVVSLFWSQRAAEMPMVVIQGEGSEFDNDQETGKTKLVEMLAQLVGPVGVLNPNTDDKTQGNDYHKYKHCTLMLMDNIRANNYGNEQLEANLTSEYIHAHKFNEGSEALYNKYIHVVTGNSISFNKDLTSRSFGIRLRKPTNPDPEWYRNTREWTRNAFSRIAANAGWYIQQPLSKGTPCSTRCRFWEISILHKLSTALGPKLDSIKADLNSNDEPQRLLEHLFSQLPLYYQYLPNTEQGHGTPLNPDEDMIFISSLVMERIYMASRNSKFERTNARMLERTKIVCAKTGVLQYSNKSVILPKGGQPRGYLLNYNRSAPPGTPVWCVLTSPHENKGAIGHPLSRFLRPSYGWNV